LSKTLSQGGREDALFQLPVEPGRSLLEVECPLGQLADDLGRHLLGGLRRALPLSGLKRLLGELRSFPNSAAFEVGFDALVSRPADGVGGLVARGEDERSSGPEVEDALQRSRPYRGGANYSDHRDKSLINSRRKPSKANNQLGGG
jgi:hypothetical protein